MLRMFFNSVAGYPEVREATDISGFHHLTFEAFTLHGH